MFTPSFPPYTGPHPVGSIDVELPVAELISSLSSPPPFAEDSPIQTIQYRIFYPCSLSSDFDDGDSVSNGSKSEKRAKTRLKMKAAEKVYWIPDPQRGYVSSLMAFMGLGTWGAGVLSYLPRILYNIVLPVHPSAPLLQPTASSSSSTITGSSSRYPVMIFSHGLWGTRTTYSYLLGSLASHGVIVVAPEHRDGSSCASFIRDVPPPPAHPGTASGNASAAETQSALRSGHEWTSYLPFMASRPQQRRYERTVAYNAYPHTQTPEVEQGRNAMLRIRCWELDLVYASLLTLSQAEGSTGSLTNLAHDGSAKVDEMSLEHMFRDKLDLGLGRVIWAGHSFGGATVIQFVKSAWYHGQGLFASSSSSDRESPAPPASYEPLFVPRADSSISQQVTKRTRVVLLDAWVFPLSFMSTKWLNDLPLPCFATDSPQEATTSTSTSTSAESSSPSHHEASVLALETGEFLRWSTHLLRKKRLLSPDPSQARSEPSSIASPGVSSRSQIQWFATPGAAHLSQSDWGVLFAWASGRLFGATQGGQQTLKLDVAAVIEFLGLKEGLGDEGEENRHQRLLDPRAKIEGWQWVDAHVGREDEDEEEMAKVV